MHDQVKGSRLKTKLLLVALLVVAGCAAVVLYRKVTFPYGHRAAVLRSMYFALLNYASEHDGRFPTSEKGNYDALQKLYPEYAPSGIELAGISGNVDAVVAALRNKAPLDQSLTSWVYMQGFTKDDDAADLVHKFQEFGAEAVVMRYVRPFPVDYVISISLFLSLYTTLEPMRFIAPGRVLIPDPFSLYLSCICS